jgi:hypothetical protein
VSGWRREIKLKKALRAGHFKPAAVQVTGHVAGSHALRDRPARGLTVDEGSGVKKSHQPLLWLRSPERGNSSVHPRSGERIYG